MICPFCHSENIEGADECVNCGHSLVGINRPGARRGGEAPDFIHATITRLPKHDAPRVGVSDPVGLAVRLMQTRDTSCVLVMNGDDVAGIITGWDILQKVAGPSEDLNAVTCGQVMTPEPLSLNDNDTIAQALNIMAARGLRHIPILRDDQAASTIDFNDVFRFISPYLV